MIKNIFFLLLSFVISTAVLANEKHVKNFIPLAGLSNGSYNKNELLTTRFGGVQRQQALMMISRYKTFASQQIAGQSEAIGRMQLELIKLVEEIGTERSRPQFISFLGQKGVGKSEMIDLLRSVGVHVEVVDLSLFRTPIAKNVQGLINRASIVENKARNGQPSVLYFDGLEQIADMTGAIKKEGYSKENTILALIIKLINGGKVPTITGDIVNLNQALVVTSMTLDQQFLAPKYPKFKKNPNTIGDFVLALKNDPAVRNSFFLDYFSEEFARILNMNTVALRPLDLVGKKAVMIKTIRKTVGRYLSKENIRMGVMISDDFANEIFETVVKNQPSGHEISALIERAVLDLLSQARKLSVSSDIANLSRPRKVYIDYDKNSGFLLHIQEVKFIKGGKVEKLGEMNSFTIPFDSQSKKFLRSDKVILAIPNLSGFQKESTVSKKMIEEIRFSKTKREFSRIAETLDEQIFGQEHITKRIEREIQHFVGTPTNMLDRPQSVILAGFAGLGKSELINKTASLTGMKLIRINMQDYQELGTGVAAMLVADLNNQIVDLKERFGADVKYIVAFEELDKVFEIHPQYNVVMEQRSVMGLIKEVLNSGKVIRSVNSIPIQLDLREAFIFGTMNFGTNLFGLQADPRIHNEQDVINLWKRIHKSNSIKKQVLQAMFLPETVDRMLAKTEFIKPLNHNEYMKVIEKGFFETVSKKRQISALPMDLGGITVTASDRYMKYLYSESVVPAQGARHASSVVSELVSNHVDKALQSIPRSKPYRSSPIVLQLDFLHETKTLKPRVVSNIALYDNFIEHANEKDMKNFNALVSDMDYFPKGMGDGKVSYKRISSLKVERSYPSAKVLTGEVNHFRTLVAAHEFGHAYAAVLFGKRIKEALAVSYIEGAGGYVQFLTDPDISVRMTVADIYSTVASRAMERIFQSDNPFDRYSYMDITMGSSSDIRQATATLDHLINHLGYGPQGISMDRSAIQNAAPVPYKVASNLGKVLVDMEDYMVMMFLKMHDIEWYKEKIVKFAIKGRLNEENFYKLVEHVHPGKEKQGPYMWASLGRERVWEKHFDDLLDKESKQMILARSAKYGTEGKTVEQMMTDALKFTYKSMSRNLEGIDSDVLINRSVFDDKTLKLLAPKLGKNSQACSKLLLDVLSKK